MLMHQPVLSDTGRLVEYVIIYYLEKPLLAQQVLSLEGSLNVSELHFNLYLSTQLTFKITALITSYNYTILRQFSIFVTPENIRKSQV